METINGTAFNITKYNVKEVSVNSAIETLKNSPNDFDEVAWNEYVSQYLNFSTRTESFTLGNSSEIDAFRTRLRTQPFV